MDVHFGTDEHGHERPLSFRAGAHEYAVDAHLDTWYGFDDTWYKVRASDGNLYILRHQPSSADAPWSLESFRRESSEERQIA